METDKDIITIFHLWTKIGTWVNEASTKNLHHHIEL